MTDKPKEILTSIRYAMMLRRGVVSRLPTRKQQAVQPHGLSGIGRRLCLSPVKSANVKALLAITQHPGKIAAAHDGLLEGPQDQRISPVGGEQDAFHLLDTLGLGLLEHG